MFKKPKVKLCCYSNFSEVRPIEHVYRKRSPMLWPHIRADTVLGRLKRKLGERVTLSDWPLNVLRYFLENGEEAVNSKALASPHSHPRDFCLSQPYVRSVADYFWLKLACVQTVGVADRKISGTVLLVWCSQGSNWNHRMASSLHRDP